MATIYTTPTKVAKFLQIDDFSASTTPTKADVEAIIRGKEDYIDNYTRHTWRIKRVYREHPNTNSVYKRATGYSIFLMHRNVKQLSINNGDELLIFDGSQWENYLTTKTEGRDKDYWLDYERGILYIFTYFRVPFDVVISYRYGGASETLSSDITALDTTIPTASTVEYQNSGVIRIGEEDIIYESKTATSFTNCTRGANGTTAASHLAGNTIWQIPTDIEQATILLTAAELLRTSYRNLTFPEGVNTINYQALAEDYETRAEKILSAYKEFVNIGGL